MPWHGGTSRNGRSPGLCKQGFVDLLHVKCSPAGLGKAPGAGKASRPRGGREWSQPWLPMGSSGAQSIPDSRCQPLGLCCPGSATGLGTGYWVLVLGFLLLRVCSVGATAASPGSLLRMQSLRPHPAQRNQRLHCSQSPKDVHSSLRSTFYSPGS